MEDKTNIYLYSGLSSPSQYIAAWKYKPRMLFLSSCYVIIVFIPNSIAFLIHSSRNLFAGTVVLLNVCYHLTLPNVFVFFCCSPQCVCYLWMHSNVIFLCTPALPNPPPFQTVGWWLCQPLPINTINSPPCSVFTIWNWFNLMYSGRDIDYLTSLRSVFSDLTGFRGVAS